MAVQTKNIMFKLDYPFIACEGFGCLVKDYKLSD